MDFSYSRCRSPTPSSHGKGYSEDLRWGCGEREQNPHILCDEANSLINGKVKRSFPSGTISNGHPSQPQLAGWMERSVQKERRTVVQGARSWRTEKRQREIQEEGFFIVWWFNRSPQQSVSAAVLCSTFYSFKFCPDWGRPSPFSPAPLCFSPH